MQNCEPTVPLWFCQDCTLTHANGDSHYWTLSEDEREDLPEPLSAVRGMEITMGMLDEEHDCFDPEKGEERPEECDCEEIVFTWSYCDGCGSSLGGERYAFTGWIPVKNGEPRWNYDTKSWDYPQLGE
jgi:hypothetical protein